MGNKSISGGQVEMMIVRDWCDHARRRLENLVCEGVFARKKNKIKMIKRHRRLIYPPPPRLLASTLSVSAQ
jgi:hypothetical protein